MRIGYDFSERGREKFYRVIRGIIKESDSENIGSELKFKTLKHLFEKIEEYESDKKKYLKQIEVVKDMTLDYLEIQSKLSKIKGNVPEELEKGKLELKAIIKEREIFLTRLSENYKDDLDSLLRKDPRFNFSMACFREENMN